MSPQERIGSPYRILYVDDEPGLLEIGKIFLEDGGRFSVDTLTSATDALAVLSTHAYDAIISDYQMPGMDGIGFLKNVRSQGNNIPFILFTGRGREEIVILALNEGADFYLQKGGEPRSQFAELSHKVIQAITRKQAEEALVASEKQYRRIVDTAQEGVWQTDECKDPGTVYVNSRMADMLGCTRREMIERKLTSFMFEEDIPEIARIWEDRKAGKVGRYERRLKRKDGVIRWMLVSATPIIDSNGTFHGSFAMYSDITEEKTSAIELARRNEELHAAYEQLTATEEELRQNYDELAASQKLLEEQERQYRNVVEDQTEFITRFLPDGTHIFVNDAYCRYFGVTREEILGKKFQVKIAEADVNQVTEFFAALTPKKPVGTIEHRIVMPDGSLRWQWWSERAIFDPAGHITEYQSVGRDITERKVVEEEVIMKNRLLLTQQETSPEGILIVDENGKIINYNRKFVDLWDISGGIIQTGQDELVLNSVLSQITDPDAFIDRVRYLYEHKLEKSFEELHLKDGRILERFSSPVLGDTGRYYGRIWYFRDVTRREKVASQLRQSEELYRTIFETTGTATVLIENDMTISLVNSEFERLSGYTKEMIEHTMKWTDFVAKEDLDRMVAQHLLRRKDHNTALKHYKFRFVDRSGTLHPIYLTVDTIPGTTRSVASLLDISEKLGTY